jgi:hypothetical protein
VITCFECKQTNDHFDSIILFDPRLVFNQEMNITSFNNFFVCNDCLSGKRVIKADMSRFALCVFRFPVSVNVFAIDFPILKNLKYLTRIEESWIQKYLPRIYGSLSASG